ncbi:cobalt-precorrin-5B (C(1))-methyltransferase [Pseudobacteriovorax antillogorgiicola]
MQHAINKSGPDKGLRTGYTTGACAAAAAKAATRALLYGERLNHIIATIPNGERVEFLLHRCEIEGNIARCSIIKDGGDDPDCTHGAEIIAEVELNQEPGVALQGGIGVAQVTKPGLGLEVGGPAINPVPRQNITAMVQEELEDGPYCGATIKITVPDGEERAKKTINARLGLMGGISILGTTGIVLPYSTAAFIASVVQSIALAASEGEPSVVFTTGGRSEQYAMKLLPSIGESGFIQVGDYIGIGIRNSIRQKRKRIYIVGMMGKLSKMADGRMMTHASASEVNMLMLAELAADIGASQEICDQIRKGNTARHVLEICEASGLIHITQRICEEVIHKCHKFARGLITFDVTMVSFTGEVLARAKQEELDL